MRAESGDRILMYLSMENPQDRGFIEFTFPESAMSEYLMMQHVTLSLRKEPLSCPMPNQMIMRHQDEIMSHTLKITMSCSTMKEIFTMTCLSQKSCRRYLKRCSRIKGSTLSSSISTETPTPDVPPEIEILYYENCLFHSSVHFIMR